MFKCIFCSASSIEAAVLRRKMSVKRNYDDFTTSDNGLSCTNCNHFACSLCLSNVTTCIGKKLGQTDAWYMQVVKFLQDGTIPTNFIGHCCEYDMLGKQKPTTDMATATKFDGHMFFPEFGLLIDSPFTCVDIHGLGAIADYTPGAWHCVLSHMTSVLCKKNDTCPSPWDLSAMTKELIRIKLPYGKRQIKKVRHSIIMNIA